MRSFGLGRHRSDYSENSSGAKDSVVAARCRGAPGSGIRVQRPTAGGGGRDRCNDSVRTVSGQRSLWARCRRDRNTSYVLFSHKSELVTTPVTFPAYPSAVGRSIWVAGRRSVSVWLAAHDQFGASAIRRERVEKLSRPRRTNGCLCAEEGEGNDLRGI